MNKVIKLNPSLNKKESENKFTFFYIGEQKPNDIKIFTVPIDEVKDNSGKVIQVITDTTEIESAKEIAKICKNKFPMNKYIVYRKVIEITQIESY